MLFTGEGPSSHFWVRFVGLIELRSGWYMDSGLTADLEELVCCPVVGVTSPAGSEELDWEGMRADVAVDTDMVLKSG